MSEHVMPISHLVPAATLLAVPWRVGQHTGRALYCGTGDGSAIGWMDTPELAAGVVRAVNAANAAVCGCGAPCGHADALAALTARLAVVEAERDAALEGLVHGWRASTKFAAWGRSLAEAYHNTRGHSGHWAVCPAAPCRGPVVDRRLELADGR